MGKCGSKEPHARPWYGWWRLVMPGLLLLRLFISSGCNEMWGIS
jgi:hypothetical protein